jgi:hypothetical protein
MENIKHYLQVHLSTTQVRHFIEIKCIEITLTECGGGYGSKFSSTKKSNFQLTENYTKDEVTYLLDALDFEYDENSSSSKLRGTIWYTDGTWSEYINSEHAYWEYFKCPNVPKHLKKGE